MSKIKLAWNDIDWIKIESRVSRVQRRIYKAKIENKTQLVHFLQKKLINSLDAKLFSINKAVTFKQKNFHYKINTIVNNEIKIHLAMSFNLNGTTYVKQQNQNIFELTKLKNQHLIRMIKDRARQHLVKMALEPEWEAVFEVNSHGLRAKKNYQDALFEIRTNIGHQPKYVLSFDISKSFEYINHDQLIKKLNTIKPLENQIKIWLQAGIMTEYANRSKDFFEQDVKNFNLILSPLLANISLHSLGFDLQNWYLNECKFTLHNVDPVIETKAKNQKNLNSKTLSIQSLVDFSYKKNQTETRFLIPSLKFQKKISKEFFFIRYEDHCVILYLNINDKEKIKFFIIQWLKIMNLSLIEETTFTGSTSTGFEFLGYNIITLSKKDKYYSKIHVSKEQKRKLLEKTRQIIQSNKASSAYLLIKKLTPIIIKWSKYFQYTESSTEFKQIDHRIFGQLRAWAFRRKAQGKNRQFLKEKYFPSGKLFFYDGKIHRNNWVLCGESKTEQGKMIQNFLPKLGWMKFQRSLK